MAFSDKAKALKEKSDLSLKEIAARSGISESMVSRYINGVSIPREDIAQRLLDVLGGALPEAEESDQDMQTALTMIKELYEARINDMRTEIDDLKERVVHEKREKWIFFCLLVLVVSFVFVLFFVDITNGNVGWFRH